MPGAPNPPDHRADPESRLAPDEAADDDDAPVARGAEILDRDLAVTGREEGPA